MSANNNSNSAVTNGLDSPDNAVPFIYVPPSGRYSPTTHPPSPSKLLSLDTYDDSDDDYYEPRPGYFGLVLRNPSMGGSRRSIRAALRHRATNSRNVMEHTEVGLNDFTRSYRSTAFPEMPELNVTAQTVVDYFEGSVMSQELHTAFAAYESYASEMADRMAIGEGPESARHWLRESMHIFHLSVHRQLLKAYMTHLSSRE